MHRSIGETGDGRWHALIRKLRGDIFINIHAESGQFLWIGESIPKRTYATDNLMRQCVKICPFEYAKIVNRAADMHGSSLSDWANVVGTMKRAADLVGFSERGNFPRFGNAAAMNGWQTIKVNQLFLKQWEQIEFGTHNFANAKRCDSVLTQEAE